MSLHITMAFDQSELCTLTIDRFDHIRHGRDLYSYRARIVAKEWRDGVEQTSDVFRHRYSDGVLSLFNKAVSQLLKKYPELKAGRFGRPRNRARCRKCGTVAQSYYQHDFSCCRCGAIAVDGGYDYTRRIGNSRNFINMPEPWQLKKKAKARHAKS